MLVAAATANLVRRLVGGEPAYPGLLTLVRRFYRSAAGRGECPITHVETLTVARAYERLAAQVLA
jgi:hypothetical protein